MTKHELANNWVLEITSDVLSSDRRTNLTFIGAYITYYELCTSYWRSDATRENNNSYLNEVIVPALENHDKKSIDEYTMTDLENAIERIREKGQLRAQKRGEFQPYKDGTLQLMRNIIARIFQGAAQYDLCDDLFRDSYFLLDAKTVEKAANEVLLVQKSVPLAQEITMIEDLLSDHTADGETVGFLLVLACGLRINESAAANFGNIVRMKYHPENYKLLVFESVMENSNMVKTSGKTPNADRAVPLYDRVAEFLLKRREYIASLMKQQGIEVDVDALPIACVGKRFSERCTTKLISDKAREIFLKHGVTPKVFQCVDLTLRGSERCEIREKSPTGYLGRHIFATQLALLDLDEDEIQAVIGHDIEDPSVTRNDFSSDEKLYRIKRKMNRMPIYRKGSNDIKIPGNRTCISGTGPLSLQVDAPVQFLHISIEAEEPTDVVNVKCLSDAQCQSIAGQKEAYFRRGIDVMQKYDEVYQGCKEKR